MGANERDTLARWFGQRDTDAFEQIVRQHAGPVYATCRRILRSDADAEDITQECFAALAGAQEDKRPRRIGPWLHAIAANRCLMHIRSEGRRAQRESRYAQSQPGSVDARWDDISTSIDEAISELPSELREPIVMHFLYGQSHGAIARAMRLPRRTVSNRIGRGVELVGRLLRKRGVAASEMTLAALMASHLGEASAAPAALMTALGKIAVAQSARSAATAPLAVLPTIGALSIAKVAATGIAVAALLAGVYLAASHIRAREAYSPSQAFERAAALQKQTVRQASAVQSSAPHATNAAAPATSLSGTVIVFGSTQAVPGVTVTAWNTDTRRTQFEVISDASGCYAMRGLTPGIRYTLLAIGEEAGYKEVSVQSVTLEPGEAKTDADIAVCQSSVSGAVLDKTIVNHPASIATLPDISPENRDAAMAAWRRVVSTRDRPLPGIRVLLGQPGAEKTSLGHVFQETITDDYGRFEFRCIRPGNYAVHAEAPDGSVHMSNTNREQTLPVGIGPNERKVDIELSFRFDVVSVAGKVTSRDGVPIADAMVTATPLNIPSPDGGDVPLLTGPAEGVTNESGDYRLSGLCPAGMMAAGAYLLGGSLPQRGETYTVSAHADGYSALEIVLPAISERVARDANEYVRNARLRAERAGRDDVERGMVKEYRDVKLPAGAGHTIENIDFVLAREAMVSGHAVDTHGGALPKCRIRLAPVVAPDPKPMPLAPRSVYPDWIETGPAGEFRFVAVPAGTYAFEAARDAGTQRARNAPLDVSEGDAIETVSVIFESQSDRGEIAGRVIDAKTQQPIVQFAVNVYRQESPAEPTPVPGTLTRNESDGTFSITGISEGRATLFAFADAYAPAEATVDVTAGNETELTIALEAPGRIEGTLTINGAPAQGSVTATPTSRAGIPNRNGYWYDPFIEAKTGDSGRFLLEGLPGGEYELTANAVTGEAQTTYFRHESAVVSVEAGALARADLDLTGSATLHGTFTFPNKYRRGRVHLLEGEASSVVSSEDTGSYRHLMRASTERMRETGPYQFEYLRPGIYTLTAFCYNNRDLEGTDQETDRPRVWKLVTLTEGEDTALDIEVDAP